MFNKRHEHDITEIAALTRDLSKQMAEVLSRLDQIARTQGSFAVGTNPIRPATGDNPLESSGDALSAAGEPDGSARRKAKRDRKKDGRRR